MSTNYLLENLHEFSACRIKNAEVLWINDTLLNKVGFPNVTKNIFSHKFSYAIPENTFFDEIFFDRKNKKNLVAERYGGMGIDANGGGVRCGNIDIFQIKGIGKNILAGEMGDHWHTYGGLNLIDAIYEAINAEVFRKILPIGTAHVYGIIITGKKTALLPGPEDAEMDARRGYGALLVREACVRPAHFFRAPHFRPQKKHEKLFLNDVSRVRNINKKFLQEFDDSKDFIVQIGKYLANYANQFAFARAARITHGSISPSNMCLDGRWLDLTNTTFLEGGKNTGGDVPFYSEAKEILWILEELIYTVSKYNCLKLNPTVLFNYYTEQFESYFISHVSYIFGMSYLTIPDGVANPHLVILSNAFSQVITSAKEATTDRPLEFKDTDPVICFIEALFISLSDSNAAIQLLKSCTGIKGVSYQILLSEFMSLMKDSYKKLNLEYISYKNYIYASALIALKRALVPEYFFMGRLENYIYEIVKHGKESKFYSVIEDSIEVADWAFNLNESLGCLDDSLKSDVELKIIIFKTQQVSIWFNVQSGFYVFTDAIKNESLYFETYKNLLIDFYSRAYHTKLSGYCFSKYLNKVESVISQVEANF